jgi:hypothetical protein
MECGSWLSLLLGPFGRDAPIMKLDIDTSAGEGATALSLVSIEPPWRRPRGQNYCREGVRLAVVLQTSQPRRRTSQTISWVIL